MRSDMWKVIVERPRLGRSYADKLGRRAQKLARDDDGSALGRIERFARTKSLNENLAPLKRYLHRQIGRPWDNVYSEIRAQISFDNVVQKHVLAHLDQFLWRNVRVVDGAVQSMDRWWRVPRDGVLYVDPRTGIIRKWQQRAVRAVQRDDLVSLGTGACLLRVDRAWFHVTLARNPAWTASTRVIDVVTRRAPVATTWSDERSGLMRYGAPNVYAAAKRQLSKRELRAHRAAGRLT